jgi:hypothetical protein
LGECPYFWENRQEVMVEKSLFLKKMTKRHYTGHSEISYFWR